MLRMKSFLHKSRLPAKRPIHTELLKKIPAGASLTSLRNDRGILECEEDYINRSSRELKKILKPHMFYVYVSKAVLKGGLLAAGHIASFITDKDGVVIERGDVSLRDGDIIETKRLVYTLEHEKPKQERNQLVYKAICNSISDEFKRLFEKAKPGIPFDIDNKKFLFEFPVNLIGESADTILKHVENLKNNTRDQEYILCDGVIETTVFGKVVNHEFAKRLNCVSAFYEGIGVKGVEQNPSPQMAAWSYAKLILGEENRNLLIEGTGFRDKNFERAQDDQLCKIANSG